MDKLERLKTLLGKGEQAQVVDESIYDTLIGMANYCIMEVVERRLELDALNEKIKLRLNEKRESEPQEEPPKPWEWLTYIWQTAHSGGFFMDRTNE